MSASLYYQYRIPDSTSQPGLTIFSIFLILLSCVSCIPILAGQAAYIVVADATSPTSTEDRDKLKVSLKAFNDAFKLQDYARASVFVSAHTREEFWSEAHRFKGKIRITQYQLGDMQLDEKKTHAMAILHIEYWRIDAPYLQMVLLTQKWQYSVEDNAWRVRDTGFGSIPSML